MGTLQVSDIFRSCQFAVDFAASSLLSFKRKKEIRRDIVDNGGILSYILTKQVGGRRITSLLIMSLMLKFGIPYVVPKFYGFSALI